MTTRIKLRRDTAANWLSANPILAAGEPGLETDTSKVKYGNGTTTWSDLEYAAGGGDSLTSDTAIQVQTGDADRWFVRLRREDSTENPMYTGVVVNSTNYDSEGNAIVAATLGLNDNGVAIFKFTSAGDLVWKKSVDALGVDCWLESNVVIDAEDNIIVAVSRDSSVTKTIVKLNGETGAVLFSEDLDFNGGYEINAIAVDNNSNIIIGGNFWFQANNNETAFVAKLNSTADTITWQHSFITESNYSYINTLEVDFNNDIIVAGYVNLDYQIDGNTEQRETMLVAKITSAGTVSWQKKISLDDVDDGRVTGISLDSLGNIYATGSYYVGNPTDNSNWYFGGKKSNAVVIFKMTTLGSMIWDRRVGPGQCSWVGVSTAVGEDGDLYLYASTYQYKPAGDTDNGSSGYWNATLALARYNKATGAVIWQSYFDNPLSQDIPAWGNNAPWDSDATDLMTVKGNKILIGGSVRLGQSDADLNSPWSNPGEYFNQGFLAQFDTAATPWSAEGWTLSTSRIPGKLTNTLSAVDSSLAWQDNDITLTTEGSPNIESSPVGVSVRRTSSKVNTWTFGKDGTFSAPEDANIKLNQKQLGYATLYGLWQNDENDIWFESVTHDSDGFAYVVGSDNWQGSKAHIYKFSPEGKKVWATQLHSGSGASFNVEWADNVYTTATVNNGGEGYKVGDRIVLRGSDLYGDDGINSLTLEVATINENADNIGAVATVTIVSGVANGTSSNSGVSDQYDDADCEVRSIAFDPVTGNPVLLISTPTYNGNTLDNDWTETVMLLIDSGSGAVLSTTTLTDEGDIYANDIAVSSTGVVAVVGEKYNEYNEYGTITPLSGSGVDTFWVAKSDIDAEHFPGEPTGWYGDWWITGTGITDQAQLVGVNDYTNMTGTLTRPGSGLVVDVTINLGNYTLVDSSPNPGSSYLSGQKFKITGDLLGGATPANDLTFTVGVTDGQVTTVVDVQGTAGGIDQVYSAVTPSKVNGSNASFNFYVNTVTGALDSYSIYNSGQDFLVGDTITIYGTQFAGGASPANDITVTVNSIDFSGSIANPITATGSVPSTHLLLRTNYGVDFAPGENTFSIKQNLGGEAFIWTPSFTKAIGGNNTDLFSGVVWNSDSSSLYAVGSGRYDVTYDQALVVKYSTTGTLQASKFVNDGMAEYSASKGAVALMAGNSIVVVHQQYNTYRDNTDEILVTKLDSDLNIVWQQFIGVDSEGDGWSSPDGQIGVAVDPATDEIVIAWGAYDDTDLINDDAIHIIKLDTDGEVLWKRIFGIHESDSYVSWNGSTNKFLSIKGDKFTIVGYTQGPANMSDNAWITTLPLDGTGVGLHGMWTYAEPTDNKIKVWRLTDRTSTTFTPNVHSGAITSAFNVKYYYTDYQDEDFTFYNEVIRSNQGGAVEFADGSKQTFSTALVPQVKIGEGRYTIKPEDSGRHILIEEVNNAIIIPNWQKVALPVGFTFTIVNISGGSAYVENEQVNIFQGQMWFSGGDTQTWAVSIADNGSGQMVTLLKIKEGTFADDGEQHGDIWMIAGADISNND